MNRTFKTLAALVLTAASIPAAAFAADSEFSLHKIRWVGYDGNKNRTTIGVEGTLLNPAGCENTGYYEVPAEFHSDLAQSMALAAKLSGRRLNLQVHKTKCGAYGAPVVHNMLLTD